MPDNINEEIVKIIREGAQKYLSENTEFSHFLKKTFLSRIKFDENSYAFYFLDEVPGLKSFENQFFNKIIGDFKENQVCRYTDFKSIFEMLNNLSYRMSGLMGMNDKSEINYVENYLNSKSENIRINKPIIKEHHNKIIAINKRYISSCSKIERKDDLTLWRLYSDDAKGVCLVFDINKKKLGKNVLLQKVKYANEHGEHKELDFLIHISDEVERLTGFKFEFRKLTYWKHFFKSFDYSIEDEVRLLIIDDDSFEEITKSWVLTYTHSILNPIIDFRLNSELFPLQLKQIVLGSKCPEKEANYVQLQEMIRRKIKENEMKKFDSNLSKVKVEFSRISHYR